MPRKVRSDKLVIEESDLKKIEAFAALGLSVVEIADVFNISRATFFERMSEMPEIRQIIQRGKAAAKNNLLRKSYDMALEGDKDMLKYLLSRVHGLSETQVHEIQQKVNVGEMSDEEIIEEIDRLTKKTHRIKLLGNPT